MLEIRDRLEKILFIYTILTEIFIKSYKNATTLGRYQLVPLEMQTAIPPLRVCAGTFLQSLLGTDTWAFVAAASRTSAQTGHPPNI